jgi:hypothetical protein
MQKYHVPQTQQFFKMHLAAYKGGFKGRLGATPLPPQKKRKKSHGNCTSGLKFIMYFLFHVVYRFVLIYQYQCFSDVNPPPPSSNTKILVPPLIAYPYRNLKYAILTFRLEHLTFC